VRRTIVVLVVSHSSRYSLQKYLYSNLSKLCSKCCRSHFHGHGPENGIFNDVTITSSSSSRHFTIFQSHGLSGWFVPIVPKIMKICLYLSKLRPKYCQFPFFPDTVYSVYEQLHRNRRRTTALPPPLEKNSTRRRIIEFCCQSQTRQAVDAGSILHAATDRLTRSNYYLVNTWPEDHAMSPTALA